MPQLPFLNRQALHLRPDPTRVIVRPFKPATEPRDLNPTDKNRANHIVERVLALDPDAADRQLADVLENFLGRHRNLLQTFEARASEMEDALAAVQGAMSVNALPQRRTVPNLPRGAGQLGDGDPEWWAALDAKPLEANMHDTLVELLCKSGNGDGVIAAASRWRARAGFECRGGPRSR